MLNGLAETMNQTILERVASLIFSKVVYDKIFVLKFFIPFTLNDVWGNRDACNGDLRCTLILNGKLKVILELTSHIIEWSTWNT